MSSLKESRKRQEKEPQKLTIIENSRISYEYTFLSSKDVSQNITKSAKNVLNNRTLTRSANKEVKLLVDDNENKIPK